MPKRGVSPRYLATIILVVTIMAAAFVGISYIGSQSGLRHPTSTPSSSSTSSSSTSTPTSSAFVSTSGTTSSMTISTGSSSQPSNCSGYIPVPEGPVGNRTPVLMMQSDTVGYICVTYRAAWTDDPSTFSRWESGNYSYLFRLYISGSNAPRNAFNITTTPDPNSIHPMANVTSVTVIHRIGALANSKGFYDGSAPYFGCDSMPMAVGYTSSQINGSDFPPRPPPHSCIAQPYWPVSVGVSKMNVLMVDIPPSRPYLVANVGTSGSSCSQTGPGYTGYVPCFTFDKANATVFSCEEAAATPSGCTVSFGSGSTGYSVTVWYPDYNKSISWANCAYVTSNASGHTQKSYEDCIPTGPNSFIIAAYPEPLT